MTVAAWKVKQRRRVIGWHMREGIHIRQLHETAHPAIALAAAERIFFASSSIQTFADTAAREKFRERWFGRYIDHYPDDVLVASRAGDVVGYLAGCAVDMSTQPEFMHEVAPPDFVAAWPCFPAHLHVNMDATARGQGIGSLLVAHFAKSLVARDIPGVHVVTAANVRNVAFYRRNGFQILAEATVGSAVLCMMGLALARR
jgi:ribosomal protein S18 acetylase RimI-like enzyme